MARSILSTEPSAASAGPGSLRSKAPAVDAAVRVLDYVAQHGTARGREIALALGLNPSTGHNIAKALVQRGMLDFDAETKLYAPGPVLYALGVRVVEAGNGVVAAARPLLREWVASTRFVVFLARMLPSGEIIVVEKEESSQRIKVTVDVGERFPISAAALGKAFLAWMDPGERDLRLNQLSLPSYTYRSIVSMAEFRKELERVRACGWSESHAEYYSSSNAVAAPILDRAGRLSHVVCSLAATIDMRDEDLPRYGRALAELAARVDETAGRSKAS
ncbi:MAG TPA: IclR family transcriptional regulator [Candidatus Dormibacteraeota bacterium]|nr:IclR family transcriptional regulator [Candidatus Dormibacteraeota bacterium]